MQKYIIAILLLVLLANGHSAQLAASTVSKDPIHVVILAGQSNMAGCGNYNALDESDKQRLRAISQKVQFSENGNPVKPLAFTVSDYQLKKRGFAECFGPELFLGITLAEANPGQEYLFIKFSQGGTALYGAWNPEWSAEKARAVEKGEFKQNRKLFSLHCEAIDDELARLRQMGRSFEIIGMAWMQGENDAAMEVSARSYSDNLAKLIAAYRNRYGVPDMPFVCGQINSHYGDYPEGPEMVRSAMLEVAQSDNNVDVIRTKADEPYTDFPKHTDNVHYNTEGQKRLGTAFAKALTRLAAP